MSREPLISPETLRSLGIRLGYLFGSRAAGHPSARSDADVAILLRDGASLQDLGRAVADLEATLRTTFGCPVHVIPLNRASPLLRFEAIRHGRVLFAEDEAERIGFEVRTLKEYEEYCRRQAFYYRAMLARLGKVAA
jgi:predicted nucleotidyltransferase